MGILPGQESVLSVRRCGSILCLLVLSGFFAIAYGQGLNPLPLINEPLVPTATAPGGPGFTLTVNGVGFVSGAVVYWNGGARLTTFVSSSQLTATIFAADISAPGTASITVRNPSPGGGLSNIVFLHCVRAIATHCHVRRSPMCCRLFHCRNMATQSPVILTATANSIWQV